MEMRTDMAGVISAEPAHRYFLRYVQQCWRIGETRESMLWQCCSDTSSDQPRQTLERIDRAITFTAYCMKQWKMRELLPSLKRLQAERDRLAEEGDALQYAERILAQSAKLIDQSGRYLPAPQNRDQSAINA